MSHIYINFEDGKLTFDVNCTVEQVMTFTAVLLKDTELKLPENARSQFRIDFLKVLNNCKNFNL